MTRVLQDTEVVGKLGIGKIEDFLEDAGTQVAEGEGPKDFHPDGIGDCLMVERDPLYALLGR